MPVQLNCPTCQSVLVTYADTAHFHNGGNLTFDSDAIPATPSEVNGNAAIAFAPVGRCATCSMPYWFVEYVVYPGSERELWDYLGDGELPKAYRIVHAPEFDKPWIYQDVEVAAGRVQFHQIGPFAVPEGTSPIGANGVSACNPASERGRFWAAAANQACAAWPMVTVLAISKNPADLAARIAA